jgi:hypothetical protein
MWKIGSWSTSPLRTTGDAPISCVANDRKRMGLSAGDTRIFIVESSSLESLIVRGVVRRGEEEEDAGGGYKETKVVSTVKRQERKMKEGGICRCRTRKGPIWIGNWEVY